MGALKRRLPIALARGLERFAYNQASHVVALSPEMKHGVVTAGYPEECVSVIPNSCDREMFDVPPERGREFRQRHPWLKDRPLVVYTGALGLFNGVTWLARLAAEVAKYDPEVRFLVIGDGKEREKISATRQQNFTYSIVTSSWLILFLRKEMPAVLSAADIATSTVINRRPLWAYSPNKVFDALAAGRPIAVNHEGWLADTIRQSKCGLVLPADNVERAARHLVATLDDSSQLQIMREAAKTLARDRFDRDMLARKLEILIRTTGEQGGGRVSLDDLDRPVTIPIGTATGDASGEHRKAA